MFKYIDCIDAATEYCPCSLAETGECLICTQLKGDKFCDCVNYKGTCIYQEYIWNNELSKKARQYKICEIKSKTYLREDIILLKINIDGGLLRDLNNIGAFVFLKKPGDAECSSTPISIMDCDIYNKEITVAIKIAGVKTKLLDKCKDTINVKGPYLNGIQGRRFLDDLKNENCLILGRGAAIAPTIMATKRLLIKGNQIYALLNRGKSNQSYLKPYFDELNCNAENVCFTDCNNILLDEGKIAIKKYLKDSEIKTVLCAGSNAFYDEIINYIYGIDSSVNFSIVNNSIMCCGEGICGSCEIKSSNYSKIKSCKQQYNPKEIFLK